ncbi:acyltransferase [Streptomyces sp. ISL-99]|uniref:acyltransferase family protein n=1 Tax=Streptomyces sp. ISL-99 TaxID=2819193 RepID=UPI001BE71B62|nr:acyltransferase [Streptomyces sp. ISL-99]MBT2526886.1 acyltransferase [Streptomyces sp. ISL-99]
MTELQIRAEVRSPQPATDIKPADAPSSTPPTRTALDRLHATVLRIDAATPAGRDRAIDVLRALAITGVVLGHWLVSAVALRADGHLLGDSPLAHMPGLAPLSWVLQPLAIFFFVGGRVAAQGYGSALARGVGYGAWLRQRLRRLAGPVGALLGMWLLVLAGMAMAGIAHETVYTLLNLVLSPLWFLLVFALLMVLTPLVRRAGVLAAVLGGGYVAATDGARMVFGDGGWVDTVRQFNVLAGWLVPFGLGAAWAAGGFVRRRCAAALLAAGVVSTAGLILWCGYPASMVGVPGSQISNLSPVTLAAVTFGLAQCGAALLLCGPLRRLVGRSSHMSASVPQGSGKRARPGQFAWAAVAVINLSAITIFLWHQTAMLTVTVTTLGIGRPLSGLHTNPDHPLWALARCGWVPVFTIVLVALCIVFREAENKSRPGRGRTTREPSGRPA